MRLTLLPLILTLAACTAMSRPSAPIAYPWWRGVSPSMLQAGSAVQKVWIRHGDRAWDLQVVLEVDQASLRFLAFAMEQPVLRLTWDGNAVQRWSSQDVPEGFDPELILEDLILIRAHATQLQRELPSGWQLLDRTDRRELLHRGRVRTRIQMRGETYLIEHPQWGIHVGVVERVLEAVP